MAFLVDKEHDIGLPVPATADAPAGNPMQVVESGTE